MAESISNAWNSPGPRLVIAKENRFRRVEVLAPVRPLAEDLVEIGVDGGVVVHHQDSVVLDQVHVGEFFGDWQFQHKGGAASGPFTLSSQDAAHLFCCDGPAMEAKSVSILLRGEAVGENPRQVLLRDAAPGVPHGDAHGFSSRPARCAGPGAARWMASMAYLALRSRFTRICSTLCLSTRTLGTFQNLRTTRPGAARRPPRSSEARPRPASRGAVSR